jgi:hypothetical protein
VFDVCIKAVSFFLYNLASVFLDLKSLGCVSFVLDLEALEAWTVRSTKVSVLANEPHCVDERCESLSFSQLRWASRDRLRSTKLAFASSAPSCALNQRPSSTTRLAHGASKVSDAAYELRARTSLMSNEQRSAGPFAGTTPRITVRGDTRLLGERSLRCPSGQAPIQRSVLSGLGRLIVPTVCLRSYTSSVTYVQPYCRRPSICSELRSVYA